MRLFGRHVLPIILAGLMVLGVTRAASAIELRIGVQPGTSYLVWYVVEHDKLLEKHAAAEGVSDFSVKWFRSANGTVMNDALLAGGLDYANTGIPQFVQLWLKTKGRLGIKGLCSYGSVPTVLVTRSPNVKTIKDFTDTDRIAVPAVKASIQALLLQMAAADAFGIANYEKLDKLTISRSHPDAMVALLAKQSEVTAHFGPPPFFVEELKQPGMRAVLSANDIFGEPLSAGVLYLSQGFYDKNPKIIKATLAALQEAADSINKDKRRAAQVYLTMTNDTKTSLDEMTNTVNVEGSKWDTVPRGFGKVADFMEKVGQIKGGPKTWKDLFFEEAHALPGS